MATVSGPTTARRLSPKKKQTETTSSPSSPSSSQVVDPYYGHEETAKVCARFVTHLFACPDLPPLSTAVPPAPSPPLANFIAYALHRARLHSCVTFAALYLLQRLKARFPTAKGTSGHRLFISAFMLASKIICDGTYRNKSWSIIGQRMFPLREINQMEREMCSYLEWHLNIEPHALKKFEAKVRRDFKGLGPYPTYVLPSPAPSPMPSTTPYNGSTGGIRAPTPSFTARSHQPPSTSPPQPIPPPIPVRAGPPPNFASSSPGTSGTPETPDSSMSPWTSPASSASPSTPPVYEDHSFRVVSSGTMGTPMVIDSEPLTTAPHMPGTSTTSASAAVAYAAARNVPAVLKQPKTGEIYARATPCVW
ncbi:cyclin-like protein [Ganoderma leucocontextum]|nr:cyclin-like protein [Ganoderma leucocontextum]